MRSLMVAAGVLATALAVPHAPARAADLDPGPPPYQEPYYKQGSPYEDPRYADIYRHPDYTRPPHYSERPAPVYPRYGEQPPAYQPPYSYKDEPPAAPIHPRYSEVDPRYAPPMPPCLPRQAIRDELVRQGWHDFHDLDLRPEVALIRARRPSGHLYRLKVDRCTGEVLNARVIEEAPGYPRGPWAYAPPPPRPLPWY